MKKITVLLLALSLTLTLCACSSSDKIPSLEEIVENGAEWSNEQLQQAQGCTLADLEKAWGEADGELPGEYAYFWKVDDTTSVNVYYHKNAEIEHITITGLEEASDTDDEQLTAPDPQPTQMSLAQVGGSGFELSEENAKTILQILDSGSWVSDATDCASDCVLTFDGRTVYYHSDCGTFNERLEQSDQSLHLSDADRETVNAIIQEVIPHDLSSNVSDENAETNAVNAEVPTETTVPVSNEQTPITEPENGTTENVMGIFEALNKLEYQPYTCDGLAEYLLYAADGTVYSINLSEKWVWRGNNEQAELSDELIRQLKESGNLMVGDKPIETS